MTNIDKQQIEALLKRLKLEAEGFRDANTQDSIYNLAASSLAITLDCAADTIASLLEQLKQKDEVIEKKDKVIEADRDIIKSGCVEK